MDIKIETLDTKYNTYHFIKISKTSYEKQQERKEQIKYKIIQILLGIILIGISSVLLLQGAIPALFTIILGIALIFSNEKFIG